MPRLKGHFGSQQKASREVAELNLRQLRYGQLAPEHF